AAAGAPRRATRTGPAPPAPGRPTRRRTARGRPATGTGPAALPTARRARRGRPAGLRAPRRGGRGAAGGAGTPPPPPRGPGALPTREGPRPPPHHPPAPPTAPLGVPQNHQRRPRDVAEPPGREVAAVEAVEHVVGKVRGVEQGGDVVRPEADPFRQSERP